MRIAAYRLDIDPSVLNNPNLEATLVDKFLNTRTVVSFTGVTSVDFTITSNVASKMVDRFMIVFKAISNTSFETITATRNTNKTVKINWTTQNEIAVTNYSIGQSNDGINFTEIGTQVAIANNGTNPSYTFTDINATTAKNWYRVKANIGVIARFTNIAMVNELVIPTATLATASIGIYPNPVVDGRVNLKLQNQAAGQYSVVITSTTGQILSRSIIKVNTSSITQTINLGMPSTGMYYATLVDEKGIKTTIAFLVK